MNLRQTLRLLARQKFYSAISITGMGVGLAVGLLILVFLRHELSFDDYHEHSDRIYRLHWADNGTGSRFATFFNPLSPLLAGGFQDIEAFSRLALSDRLLETGIVQQFRTISLVDPGFFDLFSFPDVSGDASAISDLSSAVLTRSAARELFGQEDALGQTFVLDDSAVFRVAAVVEDIPANSHLVSNIFINIENLPQLFGLPDFWDNIGSDIMYHYLRLAPGVDADGFGQRAARYVTESTRIGRDFFAGIQVLLQPLRSIHFSSDLQNEMTLRDDITGVVKPRRQATDIIVFAAVGLLTVAIASFNFANLQLAQTTRRTREIAVRRALGADRRTVVYQFLGESLVLTALALLLALLLSAGLLPLFASLMAAPLALGSVATLPMAVTALLVATAVAVLAGVYPAWQASRSNPSPGLRGEAVSGLSNTKLRSGLVTLQFAVAAGLVISCGVISQQIDYAISKSLGFDPENTVIVALPNGAARAAYPSLRSQLLGLAAVQSVSASSIVPTQSLSDGSSFTRADSNRLESFLTRRVSVSEDYFTALAMDIVAGRPLSENYATDPMPTIGPQNLEVSGGVIFNETAARLAGWQDPEDAIGAGLYSEFSFGGNDYRMNYTVVGVVNDAHFGSVRTAIPPVSFTLDQNRRTMIVRVRDRSVPQALVDIDRIWTANLPEIPIRRSLLADSYTAFYAGEMRALTLVVAFSTLSALIACLGLYGLACYTVDTRRKELGIRKVLGATSRALVGMITWQFSRLVLLANLLAWPVAWWLMQNWLRNFAYRQEFDSLLFVYAAVITLTLAIATTGWRVYRAASANPVESLRTE